ncbi:PIG-L family deacetylase [Salinisphaera sp. T31B1]|uniref:PIG-L deacetylase family protein n=1 Tax=Salinisphaera sp. T31B1 TaxID=727963 RepID=UPI0033409F93
MAPHPDDDVIAAFGLIRRLRSQGTHVHVIVVTDGAASHRHSQRWPAPRLRMARRAECRRGLARAGVHAHRVRFLDYPDGSLGAFDDVDTRGLARALTRTRSPDLLVLPSANDDHPDHRRVAAAAALAWPRCRRRLSYLVWPRAEGRSSPTRYTLALDSVTVHMKRAAILCHRTQTGLIDDDPTGFCMDTATIARFARPIERFGALR